MTISTLIRYLVGHRQAILDIASTPRAVWLGLLLVMSAGFAREYDGEDLLHEPWHLLLPLGASLATSFLLFCLLWLAAREKDGRGASFIAGYRSFLSLYWMTAPLAWLYAIPVERFFSADDATRANLWLLAIVAAWRVLLMIRVVSVLFEAKIWQSVFMVMLFADTVALVLIVLTPLPIFAIMGGIRLTESEQLILTTACLVRACGILTWPLWLIGAFIAAFTVGLPRRHLASMTSERRVSFFAWTLGPTSLLVWAPLLFWTQPEQQLRRRVQTDLVGGRIEQALDTMSKHRRSEFPPHWDPPPRAGYGEDAPPIVNVVEAILTNDVEPWVSDIFFDKLLEGPGYEMMASSFWGQMENDRFDRFLSLMEGLPKDSRFIKKQTDVLRSQLGEHSIRTDTQQARLRAILGQEVEKANPP